MVLHVNGLEITTPMMQTISTSTTSSLTTGRARTKDNMISLGHHLPSRPSITPIVESTIPLQGEPSIRQHKDLIPRRGGKPVREWQLIMHPDIRLRHADCGLAVVVDEHGLGWILAANLGCRTAGEVTLDVLLGPCPGTIDAGGDFV